MTTRPVAVAAKAVGLAGSLIVFAAAVGAGMALVMLRHLVASHQDWVPFEDDPLPLSPAGPTLRVHE